MTTRKVKYTCMGLRIEWHVWARVYSFDFCLGCSNLPCGITLRIKCNIHAGVCVCVYQVFLSCSFLFFFPSVPALFLPTLHFSCTLCNPDEECFWSLPFFDLRQMSGCVHVCVWEREYTTHVAMRAWLNLITNPTDVSFEFPFLCLRLAVDFLHAQTCCFAQVTTTLS